MPVAITLLGGRWVKQRKVPAGGARQPSQLGKPPRGAQLCSSVPGPILPLQRNEMSIQHARFPVQASPSACFYCAGSVKGT